MKSQCQVQHGLPLKVPPEKASQGERSVIACHVCSLLQAVTFVIGVRLFLDRALKI